MSQIEKLKELQSQHGKKQSGLTVFDGLVIVNLGCEPNLHFPKMKDGAGNKIKDDKGRDKRSDVSDGYTYTFAEVFTGRTVKIVLAKKLNLELLRAYKVSGKGYDIKSSNMVFIEQGGSIVNF